ncbi:MAG: class I SAM-dependent RNA methyltransferase [Planctomycetota bacterium]
MKPREIFFATCAPGVEPILFAEARALRLPRAESQVGGVHFEGTLEDAWRANLWLRTAVRVLMRVTRFTARTESELYDGARAIDWSRFLRADGSLVVDARTKESELDHSLFLEQRVKDAIVDRFRDAAGTRPTVNKDDPDASIHVHLFRDRCTLLVDTSGGSLHKRGWRRHQGRAPLSETLAAAMVLASGWDQRAPLLDPFCGSGTIAIEAALIASRTPPGSFRARFAFERWLGHDASAWQALRARDVAAASFPKKLTIHGSDANEQAVRDARENAAAAGFADALAFDVARAADFAPKRGWNAWIVTNLPYGERIGDARALVGTFSEFGRVLRERCAGFHAAILCGDPQHGRALGLKPVREIAWKNGAIDCRLLLVDVPEHVEERR